MSAAVAEALGFAVDEALASEAIVTIVVDNGYAWTGTVKTHPILSDGHLLVVPPTTSIERPATFHRDDVVGVIFE